MHWPEAEIGFFGTWRSDLRTEGGVGTESMHCIFAEPARASEVIWVAGRDVLAIGCHRMAEHALPHGAARLYDRLRRPDRDRADDPALAGSGAGAEPPALGLRP